MSPISIEIQYGETRVKSPYLPEFVSRARDLGGHWDSAEGEWVFSEKQEDDVRQICRDCYGSDGQTAVKMVDVELTFENEFSESRGPISLLGRTIACAWGRDSGAKVGDGVSFVEGGAESGGSMKNWVTVIEKGSVVRVYDVPINLVEKYRKMIGDYAERKPSRRYGYPRIEVVSENGYNVEALKAERETHLARIEEIDAILNA